MNTLPSLDKLTKALDNAVENMGGIEQAIAACDRMYDAVFIGDVITVADYNQAAKKYGYKSACETTLLLEMALPLYLKKFDIEIGECPEEEHEQDGYYMGLEALEDSAMSWFEKEYPEFKITGDTEIVTFCSYKGEGEDGIGLYIMNKHLPVFKSKGDSFNQVNNF